MTINEPQTLEQARTVVGDLPATDLPIALFPVRLETRFVEQDQAHALCVRVFPDEVHVETHESGMTEDEERWGRHLWEQAWRSGGDAATERALRDELARRFGAGRAAWIAEKLQPLNPEARPDAPVSDEAPLPKAPVYPDVPRQDEAWTHPPLVHVMPDRWVVFGYRNGERALTAVGLPIPERLAAGPDPLAPPPVVLSDPATADALAKRLQAHDVVCITDLPNTPTTTKNIAFLNEALDRTGSPWKASTPAPDLPVCSVFLWNARRVRPDSGDPPSFFDRETDAEIRPKTLGASVISELEDSVLMVDDGMRWMVDFDRAVEEGMGLRIPVSGEDARVGYDRIVVLGVKNGDGDAAAGELEDLLRAQRYTDSLAFVPQGTPSNNTAEAKSGYAGSEPEQWSAFGGAGNGEMPIRESNRMVTAEALGLEPSVFDRIPYARDAEQADARAINAALWPATWGYFLRHIFAGALSDEDLERARRHYVDFVRARGPLPVLRIGRQPYGMLPVTALDRYAPGEEDAFGKRGLHVLQTLRARWRAMLPQMPHAQSFSRQEEMEQTLADVLGMRAVADQVQARMAIDGSLYGLKPAPGLESTPGKELAARKSRAMTLLRELGIDVDVPGASMVFTDHVLRLPDHLAASIEMTSTGSIDPDSIRKIVSATVAALRDEVFDDRTRPTVFYLLLRHAMLLAYAEAGYRIQVREGLLQPGVFSEPGLVDILSVSGDGATEEAALSFRSETARTTAGPPERSLTPLRMLDAVVPGLGDAPLREIIHELDASDHPDAALLDDMRTNIQHLANVSPAVLDLLFREALDLASHRLDAWITSLASARLRRLRRKRPTGLLIGAYGWVENLQMASGRTRTASPPPGEESLLYQAADNGGFVPAPSLAHASTAAILRSGYLAYADGSASAPFAIDLSSDRVRLAEWLLDGVRHGQPLGALLGYRFERALREHALARYIRPFRLVAPFGELYEAMAEKAALEDQMTALHTQQNKEVGLAQSIVSALKSEINSLTSQINSKAFERSRQQNLSPRITKTTSQLQSEVNTLSAQSAAKQAEVNKFAQLAGSGFAGLIWRQRLQVAQAELNVINTQLNSARAMLQRQQQIDALTSQINTLTSQRNTKSSQLALKTKEISAIGARHGTERAALQKQIDEAQRRIEELEAANRARFTATASLQAMEEIEVQHVVDGLALVRKHQAKRVPFGKMGLPKAGTKDAAGLDVQLDALASTVDAVSDLMTAESVYQLAQGNSFRAGATLDALAQGQAPPPEPEIVRTPRSLRAHTHRIAVLLPPTPETPSAWKTDSFQRHARAEPSLNAWIARLLPDPARVRIEATYHDPETKEQLGSASSRLGDFLLSPLDAVYLAGAMGPGSAVESVMGYRLLRKPPRGVPSTAAMRFSYKRGTDWPSSDVSFGAFLEAARAARDLITAARPLDARDLARPEEPVAPNPDRVELKKRADAAVTAFKSARSHLLRQIEQHEAAEQGLDTLRVAIFRFVWFGIPRAVPDHARGEQPEGRRILLDQARDLLAEVERRIAALEAADSAIDRRRDTPEVQVEHDIARLQIVFGADFRVLPQFRSADPQTLTATFGDSLLLQQMDPLASVDWFQRVSHVRDGADRLKTCLTYAEVFSAEAGMAFTVGQLPYQENDRWIALPIDPDRPPSTPHVSLAVQLPRDFDAAEAAVGLMIDEWVDALPAARETAGVAFHFDAPAAHAPQSILLAVPPDEQPQWDLETLEAILRETFELAKLRTVDAAALAEDPDHGHFLPALYLAFNANGDTVSTDMALAGIS